MIESDLFSHLSNDEALSVLIDGRVHHLAMPQDSKMPAIVYSVFPEDKQTFGGAYGFRALVQIDCYARTSVETVELRESVKAAMYKFKHFPHDIGAEPGYEPDTKLFRQMIDLTLKG